ncbi:hypothetical protein ABWU59_30030 [Priestia megaterium]|uniref:hypothetical protein n=1 Tax=Priestia megaterium TaxID=1404 RepID=UPI0033976AE8
MKNNLSLNELKALIGSILIDVDAAKNKKEEVNKKLLSKLGLNELEKAHWGAYLAGLEAALSTVKSATDATEADIESIKQARK